MKDLSLMDKFDLDDFDKMIEVSQQVDIPFHYIHGKRQKGSGDAVDRARLLNLLESDLVI